MSARAITTMIALMLLAACGSSGSSAGFDADQAPIAADLVGALGEGVDPDNVPEVQRNFLERCVKGDQDTLPELPTVQREGLLAVCGCVYDGLVAEALDQAEGATFEERQASAIDAFTELEDDLRAEGTVPDSLFALARGCIRSEAGL